MRIRVLVGLGLVIAAGGVATRAYYQHAAAVAPPKVVSVAVSRGDVLATVIATGTVNADRSVSVGTQVSGQVEKVYVDFNSIVTRGQLLAEIDPSTIQAELESARASLGEAEIAEQQHEAQLDTDAVNQSRAQTLFAQSLLDDQDRETAERQVAIDKIQVQQDKAAVEVAKATVSGSETDLANTRITSPIDGVVIERDVDIGQTVAARMTAPTLFVLGTDLRHLRVVGDVDEADVAKIHTGEPVTLTVDAYPDHGFPAKVTSVRLNATVANNVVTYQVVADVDNSALQLRPGMTAMMTFEVWRSHDVLRVPTAALRFRPTTDMFKWLHQTPIPVPPPGVAAGVGASEPMHPGAAVTAARPSASSNLVDAEFELPVAPEMAGHVWVLRDHQLILVPVRTGITDGRWTALVEGDLEPGDEVVTNVVK